MTTFPTKRCACGLYIATSQLRRHLRSQKHLDHFRSQTKRNPLFRDKPRIVSKKRIRKISGPSPAEMRLKDATAKGMPGWEDTFPDLSAPIFNVISEVVDLFKKKNAEYTNNRDTFHNFDTAGPVIKGIMTPFTYCMTLSDKQHNGMWVALAPHAATLTKNSTATPNIRERLFDQAVYAIIGLALLDREQ